MGILGGVFGNSVLMSVGELPLSFGPLPRKSVLKVLPVARFKDSQRGRKVPMSVLLSLRFRSRPLKNDDVLKPSSVIKIVVVSFGGPLLCFLSCRFAYMDMMRKFELLRQPTSL